LEPLADAFKRVMASGLSEDQAKMDICGAVADGKINVRVRVSIAATDNAMRGRVFYSSHRNVAVPLHLDPKDLDWVQSRPLKPWPIGPWGPQYHSRPSWSWENQPIDLIELSTTDVMRELCNAWNRPEAIGKPEKPKASAPLENVADHGIGSQPDTPEGKLLEKNRVTLSFAEDFAKRYIEQTKAKGGQPTQKGIVEAAQKDKIRGGRELLRHALINQMGSSAPSRGRPSRNKSPK
jgi:hypothetical protein